ncbi:MAG: hypothetical protein CMB80_02765 [Flammeovirgaceae bacterium]|nr:hypothetical protein [Flammeovirgaceae bacterium]|tara:strand:+ start:769 stop:1212 length:444 start_codon:yes stop_codon:yes gene_type:complete
MSEFKGSILSSSQVFLNANPEFPQRLKDVTSGGIVVATPLVPDWESVEAGDSALFIREVHGLEDEALVILGQEQLGMRQSSTDITNQARAAATKSSVIPKQMRQLIEKAAASKDKGKLERTFKFLKEDLDYSDDELADLLSVIDSLT